MLSGSQFQVILRHRDYLQHFRALYFCHIQLFFIVSFMQSSVGEREAVVTKRRDNDPGVSTYYRTDRFFQEGNKWYFATREGSIEGPFDDQRDAQERLDTFVSVSRSGLIEEESELSLSMVPIDKGA